MTAAAAATQTTQTTHQDAVQAAYQRLLVARQLLAWTVSEFLAGRVSRAEVVAHSRAETLAHDAFVSAVSGVRS